MDSPPPIVYVVYVNNYATNPSQLHDVTNEYHSNTKNLIANLREWDQRRFKIDESALEHSSVSPST